jgi:ABC-type uncharacterized transport system permease subunit
MTGAETEVPATGGRLRFGVPLAATSAAAVVVATLVLGGVLFALGGVSPLDGFRALNAGSLGNRSVLGETLIRATPIAIIALGLIPSLKAGLFNIGSPGQLGIGAFAAGMIAINVGHVPSVLAWVLAAGGGVIAGASWAVIPAVLKAYLDINEILTTLVFNFLAMYLLTYLLSGPLQGQAANLAQSDPIPINGQLPVLLTDTRAHVGILVTVVVGVGLILYAKTPAGYRLELFGANRKLARHGGVREAGVVLRTMMVGGAAAGLAGWTQVAGVDHRVYATVADPVGYYGFFAAILGLLLPLVVLGAAFGLGALLQGGGSLQIGVGVSPEIVGVLIGLILFLVAIRHSFARFNRRN